MHFLGIPLLDISLLEGLHLALRGLNAAAFLGGLALVDAVVLEIQDLARAVDLIAVSVAANLRKS